MPRHAGMKHDFFFREIGTFEKRRVHDSFDFLFDLITYNLSILCSSKEAISTCGNKVLRASG
jgi:hypothetical protein